MTPTVTLTVTPTATTTRTVTPSVTATLTAQPTPTLTRTPTVTPGLTVTVTASVSATPAVTPTISVTPTITASHTPTLTAQPTQSPTNTPTQTPTITRTITPTVTSSRTITPTVTASATVALSPTQTPAISGGSPGNYLIAVTDNSPASSVNNYNPTGYVAGVTNRLVITPASGGTTFTGLLAATNGFLLMISNASTTDVINFAFDSSSSLAANQFQAPQGVTAVLQPLANVIVYYNGSNWLFL